MLLKFVSPLLCLFFFATPAASQSAGAAHQVPLDGISVLFSATAGDQNSAIPILDSDVALVAKLVLVSRHGQDWSKAELDGEFLQQIRRMATMVLALAQVAQLIGEEVDGTRRDKMIRQLQKQAGGRKAMAALLESSGVGRRQLRYWVTNFLLAQLQIQYLKNRSTSRIDPPESKSPNRKDDSLRDRYREIVDDDRLLRALDEWLQSFLKRGSITFGS